MTKLYTKMQTVCFFSHPLGNFFYLLGFGHGQGRGGGEVHGVLRPHAEGTQNRL